MAIIETLSTDTTKLNLAPLPENFEAFCVGLAQGPLKITPHQVSGFSDPLVEIESRHSRHRLHEVLGITFQEWGIYTDIVRISGGKPVDATTILLGPQFRRLLQPGMGINSGYIKAKSRLIPLVGGWCIGQKVNNGKDFQVPINNKQVADKVNSAFKRLSGNPVGEISTRNGKKLPYFRFDHPKYESLIRALMQTQSIQELPFYELLPDINNILAAQKELLIAPQIQAVIDWDPSQFNPFKGDCLPKNGSGDFDNAQKVFAQELIKEYQALKATRSRYYDE